MHLATHHAPTLVAIRTLLRLMMKMLQILEGRQKWAAAATLLPPILGTSPFFLTSSTFSTGCPRSSNAEGIMPRGRHEEQRWEHDRWQGDQQRSSPQYTNSSGPWGRRGDSYRGGRQQQRQQQQPTYHTPHCETGKALPYVLDIPNNRVSVSAGLCGCYPILAMVSRTFAALLLPTAMNDMPPTGEALVV